MPIETISPLFFGHPERLALVSGMFFVGFIIIWRRRGSTIHVHDWALLIPAIVWGLAALWDFGVMIYSPEANIRIDWCLILPALVISSLFGIMLSIRRAEA